MDKKEALRRLKKYNLTKFQTQVLIATLSIKKGETSTYKDIAIKIGHKNAYRAVGTALKINPIPIEIPCHRVVKSDGSYGRYMGTEAGTKKKIALLNAEKIKH